MLKKLQAKDVRSNYEEKLMVIGNDHLARNKKRGAVLLAGIIL